MHPKNDNDTPNIARELRARSLTAVDLDLASVLDRDPEDLERALALLKVSVDLTIDEVLPALRRAELRCRSHIEQTGRASSCALTLYVVEVLTRKAIATQAAYITSLGAGATEEMLLDIARGVPPADALARMRRMVGL